MVRLQNKSVEREKRRVSKENKQQRTRGVASVMLKTTKRDDDGEGLDSDDEVDDKTVLRADAKEPSRKVERPLVADATGQCLWGGADG